MRLILPLLLLTLLLIPLPAQETLQPDPAPDSGFVIMRTYAEEERYDEALAVGKKLLEEHPDYHDVALYLARIYGWQSQYDSAYIMLEAVLTEEPDLLEAHEILVDLAYWENDWVKLEEMAARALELNPDAARIRERYLLAKYKQSLIRDLPELFLHYFYDHFSQPYERNWHMLTVGGNLPVKKALLSPYVNGGIHMGEEETSTDLQVNLDAYFHLGKKNYAMAGYGFSPDGTVNYLPVHRAAAEIWQVLPRGFALSAGVRYFYWNQSFTFLTFSEEKYAGNYLFAFRSYLFFKDYGVSGSYYLSARRYFKDKFNYLTCTLGYGTAPDEPLVVVSDLERLKAFSGRVGFSKQINYKLRLSFLTGYAYEAYDEGEYRHRFDLRAGFYIRIK